MLKNITLSAQDSLIRKAREKAAAEQGSLNSAFRQWLQRYVGGDESADDYGRLMQRLGYARPGRHFDREELHER